LKYRFSTTSISTLLLSLCLVPFISAGLRDASTWNEPFIKMPDGSMWNFMTPLGFVYLGIAMIGLIVLWRGYRKGERWAWFVMLIILLCFSFPSAVLPVLLQIRAQNYQWSLLLDLLRASPPQGRWHCLTSTVSCCVGIECAAFGMLIDLFAFLVMLVALLLPVKAFFRNTAEPR
jgi:hypothetical protein